MVSFHQAIGVVHRFETVFAESHSLTSDFYFNPAERAPLLYELSEKQILLSRKLQLKRKDGSPVWVLFNGAALHVGSDTLVLQATLFDISEWKQAEEALSGMSRKLMEAQEQERDRIARELHDDVAQRLALLAIELEQFQQSLPDLASEHRGMLDALRKRTMEISNDVQSMSHELHSSKLEYLGLVDAMRSFCREFSDQQNVEIDFKSDIVTKHLSPEISLCLFRVLQEALHNSLKHSRVRHFDVQLWEGSGEIQLIASDSGKGFDVEAAMQGRGLGLTSMQERVRLIKGNIAIESKLMGGTRIHVRVPLSSELDSRRTAV